VTGSAYCAVRYPCSPLYCTCVIKAGVGPKVVCSRKRSATLGATEMVPTTNALMLFEPIAPGSGFITSTATVPTCAAVAVPVAVNCVPDTKLVVSAVPPKETVAPLTKSLPVIINVNVPTLTCGGDIPVTIGIGFSSVTALLAASDNFALCAAVTVMVFGVGSNAGAL
jgi:hypothetical protein